MSGLGRSDDSCVWRVSVTAERGEFRGLRGRPGRSGGAWKVVVCKCRGAMLLYFQSDGGEEHRRALGAWSPRGNAMFAWEGREGVFFGSCEENISREDHRVHKRPAVREVANVGKRECHVGVSR